MNPESLRRVGAILWKEWHELRRNRGVVLPTLILPLVLTALAIGSLLTIAQHLSEIANLAKGLEPRELLIQIGRQMVTLFLILPCVLPSTTAAHSIVGEKNARSLEPILATPIETWELLCGKLIACLLLGILPSWCGYGAFLSVLHGRLPPSIFAHLVTPTQLVMVCLIGPQLAIVSVAITMMISSRLSDVQAAQSVSVLVALPIIGLATSQAAGLIDLPLWGVIAAGLTLAVADLAALSLCVSLFERENILTRWR